MNILILQFLLLLILAAAVGAYVGWRLQRASFRLREESLGEKLQASKRDLRKLTKATEQKNLGESSPNSGSVVDPKAKPEGQRLQQARERLAELQAELDTKTQSSQANLEAQENELTQLRESLEKSKNLFRKQYEARTAAQAESADHLRAYAQAQQELSELATLRAALDDQISVNDKQTEELEKAFQFRNHASEEAEVVQQQMAATEAQLKAGEAQREAQLAELTQQRDEATTKLETALANTQHLEEKLQADSTAILVAERAQEEHKVAQAKEREQAAELTKLTESLKEAQKLVLEHQAAEAQALARVETQNQAYAQAQQELGELNSLRVALNNQAQLNDKQTADLERALHLGLDASGQNELAQQQLSKTKDQLKVVQTERQQQLVQLTEQREAAEQKFQKARRDTQRLEQELEEKTVALKAAEEKIINHQAKIDDLLEQVEVRSEIAETLRGEFLKRRDFVSKVKNDLRSTQQSLVDAQQEATELRAEKIRLHDTNTALQNTLGQQSTNENGPTTTAALAKIPNESLDTDIDITLPEAPRAQPARDSLQQEKSRIRTLVGIVNQQQQKLEVMQEIVRDMQTVLHSDLDQAVRSRLEAGPRNILGSRKNRARSDNLQLIKGIGWRKESRLKNLGLRRYQDIAKLSNKDALWLDQVLGLEGAVLRQDWVGQSRVLSISKARRARMTTQAAGIKGRSSSGAA